MALTDAQIAKALVSDGQAAVNATQAYFEWHEVGLNLKKTGVPIQTSLARTFNIFSKSLLEEAVIALGRLFDLSPNSLSIMNVEGKSGLAVNSELIQKRNDLEKAYRGGERNDPKLKVKLFRDKIVAHADGDQTAEDYAAHASISVGEFCELVDGVAKWLNAFVRHNNGIHEMAGLVDYEVGPQKIKDEIRALLNGWAQSL